MTERERLFELITKGDRSMWGKCIGGIHKQREYLADYLLANGVSVPPCKVGDVVYDIHNGKIFGGKVVVVYMFDTYMSFIAEGGRYFREDEIGKTVFLTEEEAEQVLKGGVQE